MAAVENVEWLNQNLLRAYPLHEDADVTPRLPNGAVATGLALPTCLITDFAFTLAFDTADGDSLPSLTGVSHAAGGFSFEISVGSTVLATKTVDAATHRTNTAYRLTGQGDNADCGGWIVVGDLVRAAEELPEGVYRFAPGQVPFEVSTLRLSPRGVRSLTAVGKYGLKTYAPLYGNVRLIAGSDMTVRTDGAPPDSIWLQAESNTGYERTAPCPCGTEAQRTVRTINGMAVENVQIVGDGTCVRVTKDGENRIKVADGCSTPCCGCSELNFVESAVTTVNKSISVLNEYARSLQARLNELHANLEATRASAAAYPTPPADET